MKEPLGEFKQLTPFGHADGHEGFIVGVTVGRGVEVGHVVHVPPLEFAVHPHRQLLLFATEQYALHVPPLQLFELQPFRHEEEQYVPGLQLPPEQVVVATPQAQFVGAYGFGLHVFVHRSPPHVHRLMSYTVLHVPPVKLGVHPHIQLLLLEPEQYVSHDPPVEEAVQPPGHCVDAFVVPPWAALQQDPLQYPPLVVLVQLQAQFV